MSLGMNLGLGISLFKYGRLRGKGGSGGGSISYPGLIAAWSAKGKTNDDEDRAILKDLTGNGHDITLNGFAFSKMSGYGGYNYQFNKSYYMITSSASYIETNNKIIITAKDNIDLRVTKSDSAYTWNEYKINIKGLLEGDYIDIYGYYDNTKESAFKIDNNGIHIIPKSLKTDGLSGGYTSFIKGVVTKPATIEIEILPEYPDALVFDGIDDYGINEDMPILTDYTVIYHLQRDILNSSNGAVISKGYTDGEFSAEECSRTNFINFGYKNRVNVPLYDICYGTLKLYNGRLLGKGGTAGSNEITIGRTSSNTSYYRSIAFYSAYLFDRSLDEQEIKAFIRKYIDPEYLLPSEILTPDCYYDLSQGSNDDENRDTIKDYSGNGNDAVAHNFAWNEDGSGYKDGALYFDGVDDYVSLDAFDSGFKTMFIECSYVSLNTILYDQRKVGTEQEDCINTSAYEAGFYGRNKYGKTYINGVYNKPDSTLIASKLSNKHILITSTLKGDYTSTPCIASSNVNKGLYCNMALYKFLGFKEALTEEQIQAVIKKYNLLDGVDEIEVS